MDLESWKNTVIYTRVHSSCLFDALLAEWLRSTSLDSSIRLVILFFRTYLDPDWNLSNSCLLHLDLCPSRIQLGIQGRMDMQVYRKLICVI